MDGDVRRLKELRLWEVSVVTFPMNEAAAVTAIKSNLDEPADEGKGVLLSEIKSLIKLTKKLSEG
jgi:phage head maturation protease